MNRRTVVIIAVAVVVAVLLVATAWGGYSVVRTLSTPERATAALVRAVQGGDDAAVYEALDTDVRTGVCGDSAAGAAATVGRLAPALNTYRMVKKADDQVWLVKGTDQRCYVDMSVQSGSWPVKRWQVARVVSVDKAEEDEVVKAHKTWDKTKHLPKGVRIVTRKPKDGLDRVTYDVELENGREASRSAIYRTTTKEVVHGLGWQGTGKKASNAKTVTRVKIGTKINKRSYRVANPRTKLKGGDGKVYVSWRVNRRPRGTIRVWLLGPDSTRLDLGKQTLGGDWCDGYNGWRDPYGEFGPDGTWVAIVERGGKPAVWRKFTIK